MTIETWKINNRIYLKERCGESIGVVGTYVNNKYTTINNQNINIVCLKDVRLLGNTSIPVAEHINVHITSNMYRDIKAKIGDTISIVGIVSSYKNSTGKDKYTVKVQYASVCEPIEI